MSNDVERLAKWLNETQARTMQEAARELLARGVTIPPAPARVTPLEAAAREDAEQAGLRWEDLSAKSRAIWIEMSAKRITAAVGALSDEACHYIGEIYVEADDNRQAEGRALRAALLARLTEGGAA